jgi:hypothetical protein
MYYVRRILDFPLIFRMLFGVIWSRSEEAIEETKFSLKGFHFYFMICQPRSTRQKTQKFEQIQK